jgi:hypothetical protein
VREFYTYTERLRKEERLRDSQKVDMRARERMKERKK